MVGFSFLSPQQFERLSSAEKLAYLSDAMEELERAKVPHDARGWQSLFSPPEQPEPPDTDPESPAPK